MRFIVDNEVFGADCVASSRITHHVSNPTLVIGYGNPLRGDDGVGWAVVDALQDRTGVTAVSTHQLLPELADQIAQAEKVIFVDATVEGVPGEIRVTAVSPQTSGSASTHQMSPGVLLAYVAELYGRCPSAYLITITGQDFGYTETLSPIISDHLTELHKRLEDLIV